MGETKPVIANLGIQYYPTMIKRWQKVDGMGVIFQETEGKISKSCIKYIGWFSVGASKRRVCLA